MNSLLPVVILAGGLATRLYPLTEQTPKALIEINGEPFTTHQLRLLKKNGIKKVIICTGFLGEKINAFLKNGQEFGLDIICIDDGEKLLGTGGAIKNVLPFLDDAFFVLYGDSYLSCDFYAVQCAFQNCHRFGLMTVFQNEGRWDTSNVEFKNNQIISYDKKNKTENMKHIDYGLGILTKHAFDYMSSNTAFDLAELYQTLLSHKQLAAYEVKQRFYEIGSLRGIKDFSHFLITG